MELLRLAFFSFALMLLALSVQAQQPVPQVQPPLDSAATENPKIVRLREKIVIARTRVANAEARMRSADSLIAAGRTKQDSIGFEVKEIEKERKIIERDHFNEIKPLERALQKAKDKETFNSTRNEIKRVETKFKADLKAWDSKYKAALKGHEVGQKMITKGDENMKRAKTMKKEADDALREVEKELSDAIKAHEEAVKEAAEKAKTQQEKEAAREAKAQEKAPNANNK